MQKANSPQAVQEWLNLAQLNLNARQKEASEEVNGGSENAVRIRPRLHREAKNRTWKERSNIIFVTSDEEGSPTSPASHSSSGGGSSSGNTNSNAVSGGTSASASSSTGSKKKTSGGGSTNNPQKRDVRTLRKLLHEEESRLHMLKQMKGCQQGVGGGGNGRGGGGGGGREGSEPSPPQQEEVVVCHSTTSNGSSSGVARPGLDGSDSNGSRGISNRLQQLVDTVVVDQALNSSSIRQRQPVSSYVSSAGGGGVASSHSHTPSSSSSPEHKFLVEKTNSLINQTLKQIHSNLQTSLSAPPSSPSPSSSSSSSSSIRPKLAAASSNSSVHHHHHHHHHHDATSGRKPPPLVPSTASSLTDGAAGGGEFAPNPTQVAKVSSSMLLSAGSVELSDAALAQMVENSRRYKDFLMKQAHVKRSFRKQIERKIALEPYPKTFRQVWPIIPVYDPFFVRNFGLEAVLCHFDDKWKASQEKASVSSRVKPICNQCGCDYASAWQIRKNNSKQLLLCEACDFLNLKLLQRSKLATQLKELVSTIVKEEEKFTSECEEARKQVVALERQAILSVHRAKINSLTSSSSHFHSHSHAHHGHTHGHTHGHGSAHLGGVTSGSGNNRTGGGGGRLSHSHSHLHSHSHSHAGSSSNNATATVGNIVKIMEAHGASVGSTEHHSTRAVIPSILPASNSSPTVASSTTISSSLSSVAIAEARSSLKRKEPPNAGRIVAPSSKTLKSGSSLDQTLDRLTHQLLKRKLDEQRIERNNTKKKQTVRSQLLQNMKSEEGSTSDTRQGGRGKSSPVSSADLAAGGGGGGSLSNTTAASTVGLSSPSYPPGHVGSNKAETTVDLRKNRRKGTPRPKRLCSSSVMAE